MGCSEYTGLNSNSKLYIVQVSPHHLFIGSTPTNNLTTTNHPTSPTMNYVALLLAISTTVLAAPRTPASTPLTKRATTYCESFGKLDASPYTFYHNNWGAAAATSGSQCTSFEDFNGETASWSTEWTWVGGPYNVKSYSNVALENVDKQIREVQSIPSSWKWR